MKVRPSAPAVLISLLYISTASAVPKYNIVPLGFDDLEHTRDDGFRFSYAVELNESGQVVGISHQFNGGIQTLDQSAWLFDGATTINIGVTNNGYDTSSGQIDDIVSGLNEAGQVIGTSFIYNDDGQSSVGIAWLYDGGTTIDIGLADSEHTTSSGERSSSVYSLNDRGQVIGQSARQYGNLGTSAWLYDGATTIVIGLTGVEHTRSDGYKQGYAVSLNEAGQVVGHSERYNGGSTHLGSSAWLYDGVSTIDIGLTGSEYTTNGGFKYSYIQDLNEGGQVIGASALFNAGGFHSGYSAWLYDGASTIFLGLTGSEYTDSDGRKQSRPDQLNNAGQVIGISGRYSGSTQTGHSAWLYDGVTTINLGFTDAEHTASNGSQQSLPTGLNEAGQVIGTSFRFNGGDSFKGNSAWFFNGATTIELGLTGPEFTGYDGLKNSSPIRMNEAGQVVGISDRYTGGNGRDAWLYDPALDQTFSLNLSTRSDGLAYGFPWYLGEDGLVLGTYTLFDALDNNLGERAFYFTIADGVHDLGSLVDGGLPANGWEFLADYSIRANGRGQIVGQGKLNDAAGSFMAYRLTPIPEPGTLILTALASLATVVRRRRPRSRG